MRRQIALLLSFVLWLKSNGLVGTLRAEEPSFKPNFSAPPDSPVPGGKALGTFDAVTAATTSINGPFTFIGTVGVSLGQKRLSTTGHVPQSWSSSPTPIAPGLTLNTAGFITGTPTTAGTFSSTVTAWEFPNFFGPSVIASFTFIIASPASPPVITNQPMDVFAPVGSNIVFKVGASGAPLYYQWYSNSVLKISGATNATFSIADPASSFAAKYSVVITNSAGSVTSTVAHLLVVPPPNSTNAPLLTGNLSANSLSLTLPASAGYVYSIESATNLAAPVWNLLTNAGPSLTNFLISLPAALESGPNQFFRASVNSP